MLIWIDRCMNWIIPDKDWHQGPMKPSSIAVFFQFVPSNRRICNDTIIFKDPNLRISIIPTFFQTLIAPISVHFLLRSARRARGGEEKEKRKKTLSLTRGTALELSDEWRLFFYYSRFFILGFRRFYRNGESRIPPAVIVVQLCCCPLRCGSHANSSDLIQA
jgi:hypothetical protein